MNTFDSSGPVAVLDLPSQNKALITFASAVHDGVKGNPALTKPTVDLDEFEADIAALDDAETKVASKGKGAAALRNTKKRKVKLGLRHIRDYVQAEADKQASFTDAVALIESAFLSVKKPSVRTKAALEARNGELSGTVILVAAAVGRPATYFWQYSLDQIVWVSVPETMKARTVVTGLSPAHTTFFRFRALTPEGPLDYSQVVSLVVH